MFVLLVHGSIHELLGSEKLNCQTVFDLTIGLHNTLCHHRAHINDGTQVLAKYQCVIRKCDTFVLKLT
jgi:hypothetical protein